MNSENTGPPEPQASSSKAETVLTARDLQHVSELDLVGLDAFLSWALGVHHDAQGDREVLDDADSQTLRSHVKAHVEALLDKCLANWSCTPHEIGVRLTLTSIDKKNMSLLCTFEQLNAQKQE